MKIKTGFTIKPLILGSLFAMTANAYGYTFTPVLGVGVEQHSNVGKDDTDEEDTVIAPYLGFLFTETNAKINSNVDFQVTHKEYLDDTFSSLDLVNAKAFLDWSIVPSAFVWTFDDYAITQEINTLDSENPDNLQTVNVFSTGPDLIFQRNVWSLLGKLRYGDSTYSENDDNDSSFYLGSVAAVRELNEYSRVSASVIYRVNENDSNTRDDYDVGKAFINYDRDLPSGHFSTDLGYDTVDIDGGETEDDPYFRLQLIYQPTGAFTIDASVAYEFTDAAGRAYNATASRQTDEQLGFADLKGTTSAGIHRSEDAKLGVGYAAGVLSWKVAAYTNQQEYLEATTPDTEEVGVNANAKLLLSDRMSIGVGGKYSETDFTDEDFTDDEYTVFAGLNYAITETLSATLGARKEERSSDSDDATREFEDDVVYFSIRYQGRTE